MISRTCMNCRHFHAGTTVNIPDGSPADGECRALQPEFDRKLKRRLWPHVFFDDWCGGFAASPREAAE